MEIVKRKAVRALLLTPTSDVLLIRIANPGSDWTGWITPGGGIDQDEDEFSALKRELYEELGLEDFELGPKIWSRFHSFPWNNKLIEQEEVYFLIPVDRFDVQPKLDPGVSEMLDFKEFRWWSLKEVMRSSEQFAPTKFPMLLMDLVSNGIPDKVLNVGI